MSRSAPSFYAAPNKQRNLRACMVCSVVQQREHFLNYGCPNCDDMLKLAGSEDNVNECTSQVFEGLITLADPQHSWVAKWQRLEGYVPGTYATKVVGVLPEDVINAVEDAGIHYIPRDGSAEDEETA